MKVFRRRLVVVLLVPLLASCGSSSSNTLSSGPTVAPTPIPPSPMQTPTAAPPALLTMEQQAANAVFDYWYSLLDTTQEESEKTQLATDVPRGYYLKTTIENLSEWAPNLAVIRSGGTSNMPLGVSWVGGESYPKRIDIDGQFRGIKSQGVVTFEAISVTARSRPITNGEKSSGVTWAGVASLDIKYSLAENEYWPTDSSPWVPRSQVEHWLSQVESGPPYWPPQDVHRGAGPVDVVFQTGKWVANIDAFYAVPYGHSPLYAVRNPMFAAIPEDCQDPQASTSCQLITRLITY